MNIKKLFAVLAGVSMLATQLIPAGALAATYSAELQGAYDWAYSKGVTTMSSIDNANMYGAITRAEMAKMLSVYARDVLGYKADTSKACNFTDIDSVKGDLHDYIILSCQLGLMGQGITAFRPYDTISRAEFGTALSRTLWGSQYEGGNPYYANHLNALKAAGIMNQIANAESTKEVRGYVMLMLQRSEGSSEGSSSSSNCNDPIVKVACSMDTDACPAECKAAENEEPTVVKAGDLTVTAKATEGRKAVVSTGWAVSDLDTLTFRTSESVTINKVTLERYGYSSQDDVDAVRLEDQDGNIIADEKSLSKDRVTLSIKKDYRSVDGTYVATIVARLTGENVGGTIGFKVVDAGSTAENLNLDNYTPYTYDMVNYNWATAETEIKWTKKDYNYTEGESYEIARLQVRAGSSMIYVRGFTLTNKAWKPLDMTKYLDKLTVKVDGEDLAGVKWNATKNEEVVVSFDEVTIDMNKRSLFVVYATLTDDFDAYGDAVAYVLENDSDLNAVEKKTWARLTVNRKVNAGIVHAFNGGKIKLVNNKLGKLDVAQWSEDVLVAEGTVTIAEPVEKISFTVSSSNTWVSALRMFVNGEEYEAKKSGTGFAFSNVEIAKSGKIQFKMDIYDVDSVTGSIALTPNFDADSFSGAKYESNIRNAVATGDVSGRISFSQMTIQPAKATLKNTLTKAVEFITEETNEGVVFDGTYTAKKANIKLNKFYMSGSNAAVTGAKVTYYLYLDGDEVAYTDGYGTGNEEIFNNVEVEAGKAISVKVVAEVDASTYTGSITGVQLFLGGVDDFDKDVEYKSATIMDLKVVEKWAVSILGGTTSKTVVRKAKNQVLAQFDVKPADGASSVEIDNVSFALACSGCTIAPDDVSVMLGGSELENDGSANFNYEDVKQTITDKVTVKVILNEEKAGTVSLSGVKVNTKTLSKEFVARFEEAVVKIASQTNLGGWTTKLVLSLDKPDEIEVTDLVISAGTAITGGLASVDAGSFVELTNTGSADVNVSEISYKWTNTDTAATGSVTITRAELSDFFLIGEGESATYARAFGTNK